MGRFRSGRVSSATKRWIAILKGDVCTYCGGIREGEGKTIDHIHPRNHFEKLGKEDQGKKEGRDHWSNLAPACGRCNGDKGSAPLLTYLMAKHRLRHLHRKALSQKIREELLEWSFPPTESPKEMSSPLPVEGDSTLEQPLGTVTPHFSP